jgi:hypothetical protein|tara:strand:- start:38 stop:688 length:651 start_codon:yes stop_codon:yes gene_type:complete
MNPFKKEQEDVKVIHPPALGWLEKKLSNKEIEYLWRCIDNRKESFKKKLAGQIHESNTLIDRGDWFWQNTLAPLCVKYKQEFGNLGRSIPVNQNHPYFLQQFWVNYQKEGEFNPLHDHGGAYSFVIWMKIPTRHSEQNKNPISLTSNTHLISTFQFHFLDILGQMTKYQYEMNPDMEGTMVFFPAKLIHCVYPFYNCDEDRISISGNITINTAKSL